MIPLSAAVSGCSYSPLPVRRSLAPGKRRQGTQLTKEKGGRRRRRIAPKNENRRKRTTEPEGRGGPQRTTEDERCRWRATQNESQMRKNDEEGWMTTDNDGWRADNSQTTARTTKEWYTGCTALRRSLPRKTEKGGEMGETGCIAIVPQVNDALASWTAMRLYRSERLYRLVGHTSQLVTRATKPPFFGQPAT